MVGEGPEGAQAGRFLATLGSWSVPKTEPLIGRGPQCLPREYPPGVLHHEPVQKRRVEAQGVDHAGNH